MRIAVTRWMAGIVCVGMALLGVAGVPAAAQMKKGADDPTQKELYAYVLTMDKVKKVAEITKELNEYRKAHPEMDKDDSVSDDAKNFDDEAKKLETKAPQAAAIIQKNGLSTREYLVAMFTYMQAYFMVSMKRAGQIPDYSKADGIVSSKNLRFVEEHFDELQQLESAMQSS